MSTASEALEESEGYSVKGALNSKTIRNIAYTLGAFIVEKVNDNSQVVTDFIISITPSYVDPFVPNIVATVLVSAIAFFGIRAAKARVAVGDIEGMYRKPV